MTFGAGGRLRRHRRGASRQQQTEQDASFHVSSSIVERKTLPRTRANRRLVVASGRHRGREESLNLWKQQLGTLPASLWDNTALETLILADNGLAELPEQIGALTSLRTLDLGHNLLTDLPESLGQLTGLTDYLYLHDNKLTAFASRCSRG